ncbi:DUF998 domain-containing protein [Pseudohongiella spirulinae]|uniref:DUF998 domain-containing protein n=1 Tax=Pseudohongiella spirulinae TaxID=1249552 RepID=A0A0S2KB52_9GAMM|nr:DUF998 domain-containing protein [Pseudohongiella spirulinae]ALO45316.1 hypothetical protein PS2015_633 [Pseudohongiella spirulinae]
MTDQYKMAATTNNKPHHNLYQYASFALVLCFCITVAVVHIVRDDLSLWHQTLSIYAVGPAGWVLTLGFFSIAGTQFLIACRLYTLRQSTGDRVTAALLSLAALGILLVAIFPYQNRLPHNSGAALQLGLFPVFLWMRVLLTRAPQHGHVPLRQFTLVCALLSTTFLFLLIWNGETDYNLGTTAMAQKAQIVTNTLWLLVYSWYWPAEGN